MVCRKHSNPVRKYGVSICIYAKIFVALGEYVGDILFSFPATEASIHTLRVPAITVSGRVVYEDTSQKMKLLGAEY
jgi:hypothetical protein